MSFTELPDDTLVLLRACCDLQVVPALCCLVSNGDGTVACGHSSRRGCVLSHISPQQRRRCLGPVGILAVGSA